MNLVWLAADRPDEGERLVVESIERWSQKGFHRQHYSALLARVQSDLYRGRAGSAWQRITASWPALNGSMIMRVQVIRIEATYLRARCALALAAETGDPRLVALADAAAASLIRERMPWSDAIGNMVAASVAIARGDIGRGVVLLEHAAAGFAAADMPLYATTVRRRLAAFAGGSEGARLRAETDAWMASQEIRNPDAIARMLMP